MRDSASGTVMSYTIEFPPNVGGGQVVVPLPGPHYIVTTGLMELELSPASTEDDPLPLEQDSDNNGHTRFQADGSTDWTDLPTEVALLARVESLGVLVINASPLSSTLSPDDPMDLYSVALPPNSVVAIEATNTDGAELQMRLSRKDPTTAVIVGSVDGSDEELALGQTTGATGGDYFVRVDSETLSSPAAYQLRVRVNGRPVAEAGPDRTVIVDTPVRLSGANSSDPDGDQLTYHWTFTGSETLPPVDGREVTITPTKVGDLVVTVEVTDGFEEVSDGLSVLPIHPPPHFFRRSFRLSPTL